MTVPTISVNVGGTWRTVKDVWVNVGGTWKRTTSTYTKVGSVWELAKADVSASVSPSMVTAPLDSTITPSATVTPSNGSGAYSYAWSYVSGSAVPAVISPTSATTSWSIPSADSPYDAIWQCVVTDTFGRTDTVNVTVRFLGPSG